MKKAIKYTYSGNPFWLYLRRHVCPNCNAVVKRHYSSKIVNSNSTEATEYDFSLGDTYLLGDVEFRTRCFYCSNCKQDISIQEMKTYELLHR